MRNTIYISAINWQSLWCGTCNDKLISAKSNPSLFLSLSLGLSHRFSSGRAVPVRKSWNFINSWRVRLSKNCLGESIKNVCFSWLINEIVDTIVARGTRQFRVFATESFAGTTHCSHASKLITLIAFCSFEKGAKRKRIKTLHTYEGSCKHAPKKA